MLMIVVMVMLMVMVMMMMMIMRLQILCTFPGYSQCHEIALQDGIFCAPLIAGLGEK